MIPELFTQGPSVYLPNFLISLFISVLAYCTFPLIFAKARKRRISIKRYTAVCFGVNILVFVMFQLLGSTSHGGAYFLWTGVFSYVGKKVLSGKNLLYDSDDAAAKARFRKESAKAGISEFEYAKRLAGPDIVAFCDSHAGSVDVLASYFDTMVGNRLVSRLCADVLIEGYANPLVHTVAHTVVHPPKAPASMPATPPELQKSSVPSAATPEEVTVPVDLVKRYCKLCGGIVDPETKNAQSAGNSILTLSQRKQLSF